MGKNEPYDIKGAVRYLKSNPALAKLPLLAYGFSMGAVSLIEAQAKFDNLFDALLLDCPFDATTTVLKRVLERLRIRILGYELGLPAQNFFNSFFFAQVQNLIRKTWIFLFLP
jgi:alpha-beta hydrolase superfamily lysophospholipase